MALTTHLPGATGDEPPVAIWPLRGSDEKWLADLPPETTRERVVTQILARRVEFDAAALRELPIGERDHLVLKLIEASFGPRVELVVTCPDPGCRHPMDVDFTIGDLPVTRTVRHGDHPVPTVGSQPSAGRFRLPVGADLEDPAVVGAADPVGALLERCLVAGDATAVRSDPAALAVVDRELERVMPGPPRQLSLTCPGCGHEFDVTLDPVALLFGRVAGDLVALDRDIHLLAYHYHWSLGDILALSGPARRDYVGLLERHLNLVAA